MLKWIAATVPAFPVGPTNGDIEAADEIWAFFRQLPATDPAGR